MKLCPAGEGFLGVFADGTPRHPWQEKIPPNTPLSELKVSIYEGEEFLKKNLTLEAFQGRKICWSKHLVDKYLEGIGRRGGDDPNRLRFARAAVLTTCAPRRFVTDYRGEQTFYYKEFGDDAIAVFVDNETNVVKSFMKGSRHDVRRSIGTKYFKRRRKR